ncbi:TorF family putative porin [Marinobacterium arenosum]|uniref:TorF family putative porin n=1 Tax=Marinobacterium arenosum TaxID=2862496 RepID=UPI001C977EB0|nr:TorF family putative porin [Marinobacterium arenosum]MBY4678471.1 TorF family putative porin [Marinobacterium arenosum]
MIKKMVPAVLATGLALSSSFVAADVSGNVALTSDYRFRGVSQSAEDFALQGGLDWFNDAGFFAGAWGSNVDFYPTGDALDDGASAELDIYAGYAGAINDQISYDITLYRYLYPGDDIDQDYNEIAVGLDWGPVRLGYAYADDYLQLGEAYQYAEANYSLELPQEFGLKFHAGYSFGDVFDDPDMLGLEEYADYSISLSKSWAGIDFELAYMDTDLSGDFAIDSDHLANQDAVVLTLSKAL